MPVPSSDSAVPRRDRASAWFSRLLRPLPTEPSRRAIVTLSLAVALLATLIRSYDLGNAINVDTLKWIPRTQRFWNGVTHGNFRATLQSPHPGVTYMWIAGAAMRLGGVLRHPVDELTLICAQLPAVVVGSVAAALTFPLMIAALGRKQWLPALLVSLVLASEPYVVETSRMAHLDMAGLGFAWIALLTTLVALRRGSAGLAALSGVLFSAGCLARLSLAPIALTAFVYVVGVSAVTRFRDRSALRLAAWMAFGALVAGYVLWPALWTRPIGTVREVLRLTDQLVTRGHAHYIDGVKVWDPGPGYYPGIVASVLTPEVAVLALLGLGAAWASRRERGGLLLLALAFVPYLLVIEFSPKKLPRYVLPAFPVLAVLASVGAVWLLDRLRPRFPRLGTLAACAGLAVLGAGRFARAAETLPSAEYCAGWSGIRCRASETYQVRDIARAIDADWQRTPLARRTPRVNGLHHPLLRPWLQSDEEKELTRSHYVLVWRSDPLDRKRHIERLLRQSGQPDLEAPIVVLRQFGLVVARVFRGPAWPAPKLNPRRSRQQR